MRISMMGKFNNLLFSFILIFFFGCRQPETIPPDLSQMPENELREISIYAQYSPVEIDIIPLTEFVYIGDTKEAQINLYISMLDAYGSEIKSPCIFYFELYERVIRSADPKGSRVVIWQDVDITDPKINNEYWRSFIRAYEFNLPTELTGDRDYIIKATGMCPNGRRLSDEFVLTLENQSDN